MGDITGRPKAPSSQVAYVPQYIYTNTPSTGTDPSTTPSPDAEAELTPAQRREKSLLSRSRSQVGTILTGFRGLLSPIETDNPRKTLLGE